MQIRTFSQVHFLIEPKRCLRCPFADLCQKISAFGDGVTKSFVCMNAVTWREVLAQAKINIFQQLIVYYTFRGSVECKLLMANDREDETKVCRKRKPFAFSAKCSEGKWINYIFANFG
jgi:hypothetical protein